jgi:hypothetical protein
MNCGSIPGEVTEDYFSRMSRWVLDPIQEPIQGTLEAPFLELNRPGREVDHSLPSSAEVKNALSYIVAPLIFFMTYTVIRVPYHCNVVIDPAKEQI